MSIPTKRKAQKIKSIIPMTNGIFSHMDYNFRAEVTKVGMDIMFGTNYGQRNPSPIVEGIQSEYGEELTNNELTSLANLILQMYKPKWDKLGEIYDIEYDPIHNYLDEWQDTSNGTENETNELSGTREDSYGQTVNDSNLRTDNLSEREIANRDIDRTRTDNLTELETRALSKTDTRTDNLTELETRDLANSDTRTDNLTETKNYGKTDTRTDNLASTEDVTTSKTGSGSENNSIYGFNSATAVNSDSSSTSDTSSETVDRDTTNTGTSATVESGSDTRANTGTQSNSGTNTGTITTANTGTQSNQGTDTGTVTTANTGTQGEVVSDDVDRTTTNTGTRSDARTITHGGKDTRTTDNSEARTLSSSKDRSGRHFGNIGNLTSQKQILEEINLWRWNYMQEILNDVKEFCTLPVYLHASEWQWVEPDED